MDLVATAGDKLCEDPSNHGIVINDQHGIGERVVHKKGECKSHAAAAAG
jgi:hypothetical protein